MMASSSFFKGFVWLIFEISPVHVTVYTSEYFIVLRIAPSSWHDNFYFTENSVKKIGRHVIVLMPTLLIIPCRYSFLNSKKGGTESVFLFLVLPSN